MYSQLSVLSTITRAILVGSGGVVNSLDFCPASLKSLGCFYFRCVYTFFTMEGGDSEFANFTLPTLKTFFEAITCCSCYRMPQNELAIFWSAKKRRKDTFFPTLHPLSPVIFATATVLAFVLLRSSMFNFHCYTQREATPTQKSARK